MAGYSTGSFLCLTADTAVESASDVLFQMKIFLSLQ